MKQNRCLNFFKGIACLQIVTAHILFPGYLGELLFTLAHWTVPFFFMISGYYSYQKEESKFFKKIWPKVLNILKITIVAISIYFFGLLLNKLLEGGLFQWFKEIFSLKNLFDAVIMNNFELSIKAGHLWFLPSLIYCYLLLYIAVKYRKVNVLYFLIPILLIARMLVPYLPGFTYHYQQNALLGGLPYFMIGYYFSEQKDKTSKYLEKTTNKQILTIILIGLLIRSAKLFIQPTIDIFEIGSVLSSVSIFLFALKNSERYIYQPLEIIGIKYSLFIYVMHTFCDMVVKKIFEFLSLADSTWYPYINPIIIPVVTVIAAIVWGKIFGSIKTRIRKG